MERSELCELLKKYHRHQLPKIFSACFKEYKHLQISFGENSNWEDEIVGIVARKFTVTHKTTRL